MRTTVRPLVALCALLVGAFGCADDAEPEGEPLPAKADTIVRQSAISMGNVRSVRFHLVRSGAPVFIDQFESLALDEIDGRFTSPSSADAVLEVTIDGSLSTKLGAVALGEEVWLSNPVTGTFEPLDESYDINPAAFFDPLNGWRPLMAGLKDTVLVGEEDRDGKRYHIRGVAPADRMKAITAGLVDEELPIDFWVRRDTGLVTASEFSTTFGGRTTDWVLELDHYGDEFDIEKPDLGG